MKSLYSGCLGAILGLGLGIALSLLGAYLLAKPSAPGASQSAARSDLSITASAAFLSSQLEQSLRAEALAQRATLTLIPPDRVRIAATTQTNALGFSLNANVTLVLSLAVQGGRLTLKTESVDTSGLPVPQSMLNGSVEQVRVQAEDRINRAVQTALRGTNLHVADVRITENEVTVGLSE